MENKLPTKIIELKLNIKLLEYLKRNNIIDNEMYNFCINKLTHKLELEKNKINDDFIFDIKNYKIFT